MKKVILVIVFFFTTAVFGLWFLIFGWYYQGFSVSKQILYSLPEYPNSSNWSVSTDLGSFPSDSADTNIYFYTDEERNKIFAFYENYLTGKGWKKRFNQEMDSFVTCTAYRDGYFKKGLINVYSIVIRTCPIPGEPIYWKIDVSATKMPEANYWLNNSR